MAVCNKFYSQRSDYTLLIQTLQCDFQIVIEMLQHFDYTLVIKTFNMPEEDYQSVIETLQIKFVANYRFCPRSKRYRILLSTAT